MAWESYINGFCVAALVCMALLGVERLSMLCALIVFLACCFNAALENMRTQALRNGWQPPIMQSDSLSFDSLEPHPDLVVVHCASALPRSLYKHAFDDSCYLVSASQYAEFTQIAIVYYRSLPVYRNKESPKQLFYFHPAKVTEWSGNGYETRTLADDETLSLLQKTENLGSLSL